MNAFKILNVNVLLLACLYSAISHGMEVSLIDSPAEDNTALSRLVTDPSGGVHLSWVESVENKSTLFYSSLHQDQWGEPQAVASGDDWFVNWADFPVLSVNDSSKVAHWLRKSSDGTYNYDVVARFYDDRSSKWSDGIVIHKDGISAEHGFVSMLPMSHNRTFITWLDGRNTTGHAGHDEGSHSSGGMTLRGGIFSVAGETISEWQLDDLACDCCQTSAALTTNGPVVVYRDRTRDEIRDIYITRWVNDQWTTPKPVHSDGWQIAGCPVNGPSMAAQGDQLAVAWFSAKDNQPQVKLAISQDQGEHFVAPIVIANGDTNGRVSLAMTGSGQIAVSWLQIAGSEAELKLSLFEPSGELVETATIAKTKSSRRSGFPVITAQNNTLFVSWTDISNGSSVKVARVNLNPE